MSVALNTEALYAASLLQAAEQAGEGVLTLTEGLQADELKRSRLTRRAVIQQLLAMAQALSAMPALTRQAMPEIDWDGWRMLPGPLRHDDARQADDALLTSVQAMVPATLMWFRVYRPQHPQWFSLSAS